MPKNENAEADRRRRRSGFVNSIETIAVTSDFINDADFFPKDLSREERDEAIRTLAGSQVLIGRLIHKLARD